LNDLAVIIICSTPYSRRIKEKCFAEINGKRVLSHILDRVHGLNFDVVVAVPDGIEYEYMEEYREICWQRGAKIISGSPESPLHRMEKFLKENKYKYVIRITHDDIIIDGKTMVDLLNEVKRVSASYGCTPSIIEGAGVEVMLAETILNRAKEIKYPVEHISYFVKGKKPIILEPRKSIQRPYRLVLDYAEDLVVLEAVLRQTGNDATVDSICEYIDGNQMIMEYNKLPEITIYTCMKNASKWITDCISSIIMSINVSKTAVEYILVDDKSNDDSLSKAITQLALWKMPKATVMVNQKNIGLASSSNIALARARGKYIMRVDADDMISPHSIVHMLKKIKEEDAVIIYPNYWVSREGDTASEKTKAIVGGNIHHHAGCALNRIKEHYELKISYVEHPCFYYRQHDKNLSTNNTGERKHIFNQLFGDMSKNKFN